jgi:hypothetical protein
MIAMAVLATLSVVLLELLGRSGELTRLAGETDLATAIAQGQLEALRTVNPAEIPPGEKPSLLIGKEALESLPFAEAVVSVTPEEEGLLCARSRVSWGPKSRRRTVTLETFIAAAGGEDEG